MSTSLELKWRPVRSELYFPPHFSDWKLMRYYKTRPRNYRRKTRNNWCKERPNTRTRETSWTKQRFMVSVGRVTHRLILRVGRWKFDRTFLASICGICSKHQKRRKKKLERFENSTYIYRKSMKTATKMLPFRAQIFNLRPEDFCKNSARSSSNFAVRAASCVTLLHSCRLTGTEDISYGGREFESRHMPSFFFAESDFRCWGYFLYRTFKFQLKKRKDFGTFARASAPKNARNWSFSPQWGFGFSTRPFLSNFPPYQGLSCRKSPSAPVIFYFQLWKKGSPSGIGSKRSALFLCENRLGGPLPWWSCWQAWWHVAASPVHSWLCLCVCQSCHNIRYSAAFYTEKRHQSTLSRYEMKTHSALNAVR